MKTIVTVILTLAAISLSAQPAIDIGEYSFDFGCIGFDLRVQHSFPLVHNGASDGDIDSLKVTCDCSVLTVSDSTIKPNDTVYLNLIFSTNDFYGPASRMVTVFTDSDERPDANFFYQAIVGQFVAGLVPEPPSLFLLPTHKEKRMTIANPNYKKLAVVVVDQ